jgi:hypothetical protein
MMMASPTIWSFRSLKSPGGALRALPEVADANRQTTTAADTAAVQSAPVAKDAADVKNAGYLMSRLLSGKLTCFAARAGAYEPLTFGASRPYVAIVNSCAGV